MLDRPETLENPRLIQFYEYWLSKFDGNNLPSRQDIDPLDFPELMPSILIVDVVPEGGVRRYCFRLFGTEHVEFNQRDLTGKFVDEVFSAEDTRKVHDAYDSIIETRTPHHWRSNIMLAGREFIHYERLMLPLASDGKTVDKMIGVFEFGHIGPATE